MQSSSRLFPVQLVSAELIGAFVEDIYLLKPNNSPDRSVELAVTRLSKNNDHHGEPVILLHGSFSNRRHWLSAEGLGIAAYLVDAGYDVWLPEMRGHGLSPANNDFAKNSLDKIIKYDLPAIHKFVVEQTGKDIAWIGEELGGFLIMSALALGAIDQKTVSNCVYLEEAKPLLPRLNNSKIYSKKALWRWKKPGVINGRSLKLGSENESYPIVKEFLRWQSSLNYSSPAGLSLDDAFKNITAPTMVVAINTPIYSAARNPQWIHNQLLSAPKILKEYDYSLPRHKNIYAEGGGTLSELASGCWRDIVYWLEKEYDCLGPVECEVEYRATDHVA